MYALAIIRYRRPLDEILPLVDEHRSYLRDLQARGILLVAGPLDPRHGGALLLRVSDDDVATSLDAVRDGDPYIRERVAQYELLPWAPIMGVEALDRIP